MFHPPIRTSYFTTFHDIIVKSPYGAGIASGGFVGWMSRWQDLLGAALGVFSAIIIPIGAYWIKNWRQAKLEHKENLRRIEIASVRSLDDIGVLTKQLQLTRTQIEFLIDTLEAVTDERTRSLNSANFPVTGDIYRDADLPMLATKSYYLHNKLLILDNRLKAINKTMVNVKEDFEKIIEQNRFLIAIGSNPVNQREEYIQNLKGFSAVLDEYIGRAIPESVRHLFQISIYNRMLRRDFSGTIKRYEKVEVSQEVEMLDVIDKRIAEQTKSEMERFEKRLNEIDRVNTRQS